MSAPHGPEQLPDEQPVNPTDLTNQASLQRGAASRWLVPSGVLAVVVIVMFCLALSLQLLLPIIGIVYVTVMWFGMLAVSRLAADARLRNRRLAWFMGSLAVGALIVFVGIYLVETLQPMP